MTQFKRRCVDLLQAYMEPNYHQHGEHGKSLGARD